LKTPLSKGLSITMVQKTTSVCQTVAQSRRRQSTQPTKSGHYPTLHDSAKSLLTIKTCAQCKRENAFHYSDDASCVECALSITEGN